MSEERDMLVAGDPVSVSGRLIVPIVRILRFYADFSYAASVNPVALLIIDGKDVFFATIDAGMDEDSLFTFLDDMCGINSRQEKE